VKLCIKVVTWIGMVSKEVTDDVAPILRVLFIGLVLLTEKNVTLDVAAFAVILMASNFGTNSSPPTPPFTVKTTR